jgi:hypothetical protein
MSIKAIAILILIGAFPLSAGRLFHSDALSWTGVGFIAVACIWFLAEFLVVIWRFVRLPDSRVVRTLSKALAEEYVRVGWTLKQDVHDSATGKPIVYCIEWLRDSKPARPTIDPTKFKAGGVDA